MSTGHLFNVKVTAMVDDDLNKILNALQDYHIGNQWHQCCLQHIIGKWAMLTDLYHAEATASGSSEASELIQPSDEAEVIQSTESLPKCLTHCSTEEAPLAKHLRQDLIQLLGKVEAKAIVDKLTAKAARISGKIARLFFFDGNAVTLKV